MQTVISVGATLLSAVLGRKVSSTTIGKATTAARGAGYASRQAQDVDRAREDLEALEAQIVDLEREFEADADEIRVGLDPASLDLKSVTLKPRKSDIDVRLLALAWTPYSRDLDGTLVPAWRSPRGS